MTLLFIVLCGTILALDYWRGQQIDALRERINLLEQRHSAAIAEGRETL